MKILSLFLILLTLTGCQPDFDFVRVSQPTRIIQKTRIDSEISIYRLHSKYDRWDYFLDLTLPSNFGEVNYIITTTNGIQAWKP